MVPVREAINSGTWFHFSSSDGDMQFRLKVLSFEKLDLSQVDEPQNIDDEETGACWWLMKIEAINLSKQSLFSPLMLREMLLMRVETLGHDFSGIRRTFSAQSLAIAAGSMPISARIAAPC